MQKTNSPISYIIYARKSTESEDRQVASIDSQISELKILAQRERLQVGAVLSESQSAKAPGRPVFNEVLGRIHRGEAQGILCWNLDRLARNPVDGGTISWMLQQGSIQRIQTHDRSYCPTDNVLMMSVEFGMANQYIRDLSQNVKRGLYAKAQQGWFPGVAKPGYVNDAVSAQGHKTTPKDHIRFRLIKRAFKLMLTGRYGPGDILTKLNCEWAYRTPKKRKLGGRPLSRSTFYDLLSDPFYYGVFEYPKGSGNWYQGKHEPMITENEFWRIQKLLGKKGRARGKHYTFAYTGLMQCAECSAAITAHTKEQTICSACKTKFASKHSSVCSGCDTGIADMHNPKHLHYEYYHFTKRKTASCSQGAIEVEKLEVQILEILDTITISERLKQWSLELLEKEAEYDAKDHKPIVASMRQALEDCQKRVNNLLALKISPQNSDGELLSDVEFAKQKQALQREMERIKLNMAHAEKGADQWLPACEKAMNFACYAKAHFENGTLETKRAIVGALGSNLLLGDKKLRVCLHKHFVFMQRVRQEFVAEKVGFEPKFFGLGKRKNRAFGPGFSRWLGLSDDVRTYFSQVGQSIYIPVLSSVPTYKL